MTERARTSREELHALVDQLDDEAVEALRCYAEMEYTSHEPLTAQQVAGIRRRLEAGPSGSLIPHDHVRARPTLLERIVARIAKQGSAPWAR